MDAPKSETRLGDWYANLLHIGKQQMILCVSERTLLPVVIPARNARDLSHRLPLEMANVLRALAVPVAAITPEAALMREVVVTTTANRQVLGSMNGFAFALQFYLEDGMSLLEASLRLANTPCSPIGMGFPQEEARALLLANPHLV